MNTLQEIQDFINDFNTNNNEDFSIDSIRINFSKQYKKEKLDLLGKWKRLKKNSNILHKLKDKLAVDEVTSALQLDNHQIYYYNKRDNTKKYRTATMVIFGLKQYHKDPPPHHIVNKIISILKDVTNIDLCWDMPNKPNIELLKNYFSLKQYVTKNGFYTDTHYINDTDTSMIEKIVIYNKALKNGLDGVLWRIEALITIPNIKYLALPLHEFKEITDIAKGRL